MPETIKWSVMLQAVGGPAISDQGLRPADGYTKLQVNFKANDAGATDTVDIPDGTITMLMIQATRYVDNGNVLSYSITDTSGETKNLNGPLLLIGRHSVELLAATLDTITFKNPFSDEIIINILMGLDTEP